MGTGNESLYKTYSRSHDQDGRHARKPSKVFFPRTRRPMILKHDMQHWGLKLYKDDINNDPRLTLNYFTARSNLVAYVKSFNGEKLAANDQIDRRFMFSQQYCLRGCLPLHRGYLHVYDHYFQTSFSLKPLGPSNPNFMGSLLLKRGYKFVKMVSVT